jgi:hypothetical protein
VTAALRVLLFSTAAGATFSPIDPVWIFLGSNRLAAKTQAFEGWKSLDFLGFTRPNRAFSRGYAGFSLKEISRALFAPSQNLGTPAHDLDLRKGTDWSWGKLNSISGFLQEITGAHSITRWSSDLLDSAIRGAVRPGRA